MSVISARNALGRLFLLTVISLLSQWTSQARASGSPETALKPTTSTAIAKWASTSSVELVIPLEDELSMEEVQLFISKAKKISRNGRHYALIETFTEKSSAIVAGRSIQDSLPWTLFMLVYPEPAGSEMRRQNNEIHTTVTASAGTRAQQIAHAFQKPGTAPGPSNRSTDTETQGRETVGKETTASLLGGTIGLEPWQKYLHAYDLKPESPEDHVRDRTPNNNADEVKKLLQIRNSEPLAQHRSASIELQERSQQYGSTVSEHQTTDNISSTKANPNALSAANRHQVEITNPATSLEASTETKEQGLMKRHGAWIEASSRLVDEAADDNKDNFNHQALRSNPRAYRSDLNYLIIEIANVQQLESIHANSLCSELRRENGRFYCQVGVYVKSSIGERVLFQRARELLRLGFMPRVYSGGSEISNILGDSIAVQVGSSRVA